VAGWPCGDGRIAGTNLALNLLNLLDILVLIIVFRPIATYGTMGGRSAPALGRRGDRRGP
jgi:hypothetical protein